MRFSQWLLHALLLSLLLVLTLSVDTYYVDANAVVGAATATTAIVAATTAANSVSDPRSPQHDEECALPLTTTASSNKDEVIALQYLSRSSNSNSPYASSSFRVHGWRWHTASVLRELKLLYVLLLSSSNPSTESSTESSTTRQAVDHVIGFNMKGLHRVEESLFFPWFREKLNLIVHEDSKESFQRILSSMMKHHNELVALGKLVIESVHTDDNNNHYDVANLVQDMMTTLEEIRRIQNDFMVPSVSRLVSESDQVSFNNQVLRNMGLLDSRIYLVGMYEAVLELLPNEIQLFEKEIPMIPRYMIPRWKRLLYDPLTTMLVHETSGDYQSR